jgi:hypothetical protein
MSSSELSISAAAPSEEWEKRLEEKLEKVIVKIKPGLAVCLCSEKDRGGRERKRMKKGELCSSDRKEGGGDSGLGRKRKEGIAKKRRSLSILPEFHLFPPFRPTEKDVLWERLLFARSHHRSWDELTPHHPATQHEKKLPAWTLVFE